MFANGFCFVTLSLDDLTEYSNRIKRAEVVSAGVEPEEFQQLFPFWTRDEKTYQSSVQEGRPVGVGESVKVALDRIEKSVYPLEHLIRRPLHEDIHPLRLEQYLSREDFQSVFGMDRETFQQLPFWRRKQLKQEQKLT